MASHARSTPADATTAFVSWLVTVGGGPAVAALPVNLVAHKLAGAAVRWFKRFRQTDDLSRLVKAAAGASFQLSRDEIRDLRKLLEKEQTWHLLAVGRLDEKLEELTRQIADCLPARDGRTAEETHAGAEAIARGLLEFAVFELEREIFQKVVLARLQQMSDQASALDQALFRMHKDLYHLVGEAKDLFTLVSDRLPPGRADLNEVKIYLTTLIGWLNADPWPQRLGGPTLTPAAIERKLWINATDPVREQDADADELARQCSRLVILGGPGSGKTWLAMRTARICAEEALAALEAGRTLDEVELPLYTTCSRLVSAPADVGIPEAVASSAIARIGDLGGSRILKALCLLFTERDRRTLLVIDSLDEALDAGEARDRLREADSLRPPWRVVLTSRHSSWSNQLNIQNANPAHRIGDLQPLRYPADVEAVIQQWFANSRPHGQALVNAIAERPGLQQAATVPLVLAFYCILGSDRILSDAPPLPAFRHKLYRQVIDRMLHGPWHRGGGRPPDLGACRAVLLTWAWPGVTENHPVSGVGQWEDDIPTEDVSLSQAGQIAVDHIVAPSGGPGFDADETLRRFVHRSLREHLVAEHVASLPAEQAVQELLPHLWYDPDWEYTAPAALAMHPQRDWVLKELIRRVAGGDQLPADLAQIDGCWEIRRFLARAAQESGEGAWPPEAVEMIGQARLDLAKSRQDSLPLVVSSDWPTWNGLIIESLRGRLAGGADLFMARELAEAVARLAASAEDRVQARQALLALLTGETNPWIAEEIAAAIDRLNPTPQNRARAREALLRLLMGETDPAAALHLADAIARLDPSPKDRARAWEALINLLTGETTYRMQEHIVDALARLDPSPEDRARAREALLSQLVAETNPEKAWWLLEAVLRLVPAAEDPRRDTYAELDWLIRETDPETARQLAGRFTPLAEWAQEQTRAERALLAWPEEDLAVGRLEQASKDRARARQELLDLPENERARALERLLSHRLVAEADPWTVKLITDGFAPLDPASETRTRARETLLSLLKDETDPTRAGVLADAVSKLSPTVADLSGSETWPFPPTPGLLAAARRNSGLPAWLAALPLLSRSAHTAADSDSAPTPPNNG
jgi:hypothetical protein